MSRPSRLPSIVGCAALIAVIGAATFVWPFPTEVTQARPLVLGVSPRAKSLPPLRILLVGDSLADSATEFFTEAATGNGTANVDSTLVRGGAALCDWLPELADKLQELRPKVAVVQLSGNSITPCMSDPATGSPYEGDAWLRKYRADAQAAAAIFDRGHVEVYWVGSPVSRDDNGANARLNSLYEQLGRRSASHHYVDAGAAVLDGGRYTEYLPCEPTEPCTERDPSTGAPAARVRGADGGHFCPDGVPAVWGVTQPCTTWSSGAWRFGRAMADPVVARFGL